MEEEMCECGEALVYDDSCDALRNGWYCPECDGELDYDDTEMEREREQYGGWWDE